MDFLNPYSDVILANYGLIVPIMAVFVRMSVFIYLLPGIGETVVPQRVRLSAALLLTLMMMPLLTPTVEIPDMTIASGTALMAKEGFYGFILGFSFRLMVFCLQILGNIMSQALSISQVLGEGIATEPNTTISTLLMMVGVTLLVTLDLHVEAVGVFYRSYETFPLGTMPNADNVAYWMTNKSMDVFAFGVTLALPFIILNFVYNLMLGFLNRAMPQLMVSFVGMPAITGAGLFLLVVSTGTILTHWLRVYTTTFNGYEALTHASVLP